MDTKTGQQPHSGWPAVNQRHGGAHGLPTLGEMKPQSLKGHRGRAPPTPQPGPVMPSASTTTPAPSRGSLGFWAQCAPACGFTWLPRAWQPSPAQVRSQPRAEINIWQRALVSGKRQKPCLQTLHISCTRPGPAGHSHRAITLLLAVAVRAAPHQPSLCSPVKARKGPPGISQVLLH